jgi:fibronectin type 3 domain-containing protein
LLKWEPSEHAQEYRIYRGLQGSAPALLETSKKNQYLDSSAQYDTPYVYTAIAVNGLVESEISKPTSVPFSDSYGPAAPTGLTALAAPNSIELSWQRNAEADFKSYQVYRSIDGGALEPLGTPLNVPAFSDHQVEHGKTYRYAIGAVDQKNNASEKSSTVEVNF